MIAKTNTDIFDVDHVVDFSKAIEVFKGTNTVANGNLNPVTEFLQANEEEIVLAVKKRLDIADERTLISGGCEIPGKTSKNTMIAMNSALYY